MTRYEVEHIGSQWSFQWPEEQVTILVRNPREIRSDITCVIEVRETVNDEEALLAAPTRTNLSSARSKYDLVQALAKRRDFGTDSPFNWPDALESVATVVMRDWTRGEPIVDLSGVEVESALPYLIYPFLPTNEPTIIYGDGGNGKSLFAMLLALAVRTGRQIPHAKQPAISGPVLYLDWETHELTQARRLQQVAKGFGLTSIPTNVYYRRCTRPITEDAEALRVEVAKLSVALVVVDSLGWAAGADINESSVAIPVMSAIRSLGTTALVIAHSPKGERNVTGRRSVAGSSFFEFAARSAWELRAKDEKPGTIQAAFYHRKANDNQKLRYPLGYTITFSGEEGRPVIISGGQIAANSELASGAGLPDRIRAALGRATRPTTPSELAAFLDAKVDSVRAALRRMDDVVALGSTDGKEQTWALKAAETRSSGPSAPKDDEAVPVALCARCGLSTGTTPVPSDDGELCLACADEVQGAA